MLGVCQCTSVLVTKAGNILALQEDSDEEVQSSCSWKQPEEASEAGELERRAVSGPYRASGAMVRNSALPSLYRTQDLGFSEKMMLYLGLEGGM